MTSSRPERATQAVLDDERLDQMRAGIPGAFLATHRAIVAVIEVASEPVIGQTLRAPSKNSNFGHNDDGGLIYQRYSTRIPAIVAMEFLLYKDIFANQED